MKRVYLLISIKYTAPDNASYMQVWFEMPFIGVCRAVFCWSCLLPTWSNNILITRSAVTWRIMRQSSLHISAPNKVSNLPINTFRKGLTFCSVQSCALDVGISPSHNQACRGHFQSSAGIGRQISRKNCDGWPAIKLAAQSWGWSAKYRCTNHVKRCIIALDRGSTMHGAWGSSVLWFSLSLSQFVKVGGKKGVRDRRGWNFCALLASLLQ